MPKFDNFLANLVEFRVKKSRNSTKGLFWFFSVNYPPTHFTLSGKIPIINFLIKRKSLIRISYNISTFAINVGKLVLESIEN